MATSLDQLNFDVWLCITPYLDLEDIAHLVRTCKHLKEKLADKTVCRLAVQVRQKDMLTSNANAAHR